MLLTAGCGQGSVEIDAPALSATDAAACRSFVDALPDTLAGQDRAKTTGDTAYGAAWGDPAIVVTCGVGPPKGFTDTSTCVQVDSTGWYVPDSVLLSDDQTKDVTATELNYRPRVELRLPGKYRPDGFANATGALAQAIEATLKKTGGCV